MSGESLRKKTDIELKAITDEVVKRILENDKLRISKIILYGSYARGDADDGSDIDIMVLCNDSQEKANAYAMDIFRRADQVAFENDILIQTNVKNEEFFNHWVDDLPYYYNIKHEGVMLYGR